MYVTNDVVADKPQKALDALSDHGRADMADMQLFSDVRPSVIHDDLLRSKKRYPETLVACCRCQDRGEKLVGQRDIDEPGTFD